MRPTPTQQNNKQITLLVSLFLGEQLIVKANMTQLKRDVLVIQTTKKSNKRNHIHFILVKVPYN